MSDTVDRIKKLCWMLLFLTVGCLDFEAVVLPNDEPKLVVDALLSDTREFSYVDIGWSYPAGTNCTTFYNNKYRCVADTSAHDQKVKGKVRISEEAGFEYEYSFSMADRTGYLRLPLKTDIVGVPGKKYHLYVEVTYNNATTTYHAETTMLTTPAINNIVYEIRKGDVGKFDGMVPLISFHEPQNEKNWYLFTLCSSGNDNGKPSPYCDKSITIIWPFSVLADTFLPENIVNLSVDSGISSMKYLNDFYPVPDQWTVAEVQMFAIDRTTYQFYKALLQQFDNDGGIYGAVPATPAGNMSNGALGIFRATQLSFAQVAYDGM